MNVSKYNITGTYILNSDEIAGGASKVMLDIFNSAGFAPPLDLLLLGLYIYPKTDVAVTGVVSARFDLFRTTSIGTGGAGASIGGGSTGALNISKYDQNDFSLINGPVSARSAPTGGATGSTWLGSSYIFPEETNAGALLQQNYNLLPADSHIPPFVVHEGNGLMIKQGTVVSVNSYFITLIFALASARPL